MNSYYDILSDEDRQNISEIINLLYGQTFLMERSYDRRTGRYVLNKMYRECEQHFDFLRDYFKVANIELVENRQFGIFALQSQNLIGTKLSKLTTIFILLLKLIFDEKMNTASNSVHVYTTIAEVQEKIQLFRLWDNRSISITEVRRTVSVLKKYQIIEVLDDLSDIDADTRLIIYPTIHLVLNSQEIEGILEQYKEDEEEEHDNQTISDDEDVSEQLALY